MKSKAVAPTMQGTWLRDDEGQHGNRLLTPTGGFDNEARCRAVRVHPDRPGEVLAGTDPGLYRYREESGRFDHIPSPMDSPQILQIAQDPREPDFIVRGARPGVAFIFEDNGGSWFRSNFDASTEFRFINTSRGTSIHFDPRDRRDRRGIPLRQPGPDQEAAGRRSARQRHA